MSYTQAHLSQVDRGSVAAGWPPLRTLLFVAPLFFVAGVMAPFALAEISHGHAGFDAVACLATRASADISAVLQVLL